MDSETEINLRYADLTTIIRPDKRYGKIFYVLIKFKFISLKNAGIIAEAARKLFKDKLARIHEIVKQMEEFDN
ncbi:hypothetical protein [Desulfobacula phenolica]|uniref:Uncharacterized protein n=1 Tax=Desulfobacula phenolica TaxID=90732 RepID=A0A1H2DRG0_9BACT|nr:hypothetical protein [Desulfobacula phenolica]SDT85487.1 hypothetical protein SAMN04487931_10226 [Desulfobacula phenolica]